MQRLGAPRIDDFKLLHESHNHDTSTGTREIDKLHSNNGQYACNKRCFVLNIRNYTYSFLGTGPYVTY